ncbi:MAG: YpdA family putative bacillithiol disulfide reductase [Flavobacteriaceae bacterium]
MTSTEVVIVGGGPIGIACGIALHKRGIDYTIIEKGTLVNSLFNYPKNMRFFSSSKKLEIDEIPFVCDQTKPTRDQALEYYRRVTQQYKLNLHLFEKVERIENQSASTETKFIVHTDKNTYSAQYVILATGFFDIPKALNIKGEDLPKVSHYFDDGFYYVNQKLVVVGASNSAIDAALECHRKGADVTLVIRGAEVGQRVKYWVRPDIINRIEEGSIKAYYESELLEITPSEVVVRTPDETLRLENDFVLAMTGYQPNFQFLNELGVSLSEDEHKAPSYDEQSMQSNIPGVYLAGVIVGGMKTHKWFIENSIVHADLIAQHIATSKN